MYDRCAHVFCSAVHMSTAFLRHHVKLKVFQLLHEAQLINVRSKTVDQSEDPGGGARVASFLFTVTGWQLFYLTTVWQRRHCTLHFFKNYLWVLRLMFIDAKTHSVWTAPKNFFSQHYVNIHQEQITSWECSENVVLRTVSMLWECSINITLRTFCPNIYF